MLVVGEVYGEVDGGLAPLYWSFVLHLFQYPATTKQERIGEKSKFFKKRQVDLVSISTHKDEQTNTKDRGASNNSLELFHLVEKICKKKTFTKNGRREIRVEISSHHPPVEWS